MISIYPFYAQLCHFLLYLLTCRHMTSTKEVIFPPVSLSSIMQKLLNGFRVKGMIQSHTPIKFWCRSSVWVRSRNFNLNCCAFKGGICCTECHSSFTLLFFFFFLNQLFDSYVEVSTSILHVWVKDNISVTNGLLFF